MNKRANNEIFLPKIVIAIALVAIFAAGLWMIIGQDTVAVQNAKEAYAQYLSENPGSQDKDFIYIYEDTVIVAIRNGKVVRKEYATEADAVKAALGSKDGANYSLAGTGNGKLFVVKLFQKTDDIYALGTSTLATGADKLTIKVVSNGMIFATFEIPAEAIDRKQSPVGVTIKKINAEDYITLREDQGGFGYDIDVTNLVENNTARIAITINGPKGLVADANKSPITAYHKDKIISSTYDAKTGQISFSTTSFSPFPLVVENAKTVDNVADLRYWLQHDGAVNIILGADIDINLDSTDKNDKPVRHDGTVATEDDKGANVTYPTKDPDGKDATVLLSRGFYENDWIYFGALVRGEKYLDLNGYTITYKGGTNTQDNALFCVVGKSYFAIGDGVDGPSEDNGAIEVMFDHYAVWSMDNTSVVDIYDGYFVSDGYVNAKPEPNRALLYSSGGEIHVRGGWFVYENTNDGKTNGGFNVLDEITGTRIWIHSGAFMSAPLYRQSGATEDAAGNDDDSIELVGGTDLVKKDNVSIYDVEQWYQVNSVTVPVKLPHKDSFIYRVGNLNDISLESLFDKTDFNGLSARVVDVIGTKQHNSTIDKNYTSGSDYYKKLGNVLLEAYDGDESLNFSDVKDGKAFSGLVRVELVDSNGAIHSQIYLEVVDGKNVTQYSDLGSSGNGNYVLLDNIKMSSNGSWLLSNGTLYGNGYTFDVTDGAVAGSGTVTGNYLVYLKNANLDNIQIVGPVYSDFSLTTGNEYNRPAVLTTGTCAIYNSYISNAASPVRLQESTLTIVNTTLKGGSFANIDIRSGNLILDDVTTINQVNGNDKCADGTTIVGLGIVIWYEKTSGNETIHLVDVDCDGDAELNQYNYISSNDSFASGTSKYKYLLFGLTSTPDYVKTVDSTEWVNAGVLSLTASIGGAESDQISTPDGYTWYSVSGLGSSGNLCTQSGASISDPTIAAPEYTTNVQYRFAPEFSWDYPEKTDSTDYTDTYYCYYDTSTGTILISFEDEDKGFSFNPSILTAIIDGEELDITVTMNGVAYSGNITFNNAGDYVITYTCKDPYNYRPNEGGIESYDVTYTYTVNVTVSKVEKDANPPTITFGSTGTEGKLKYDSTGKTWYFSADGYSSTGSYTKGDQTIYYPLIYVPYTTDTDGSGDLITSNSNTNINEYSPKATVFCPIFDGVITITDNGLACGSGTTEKPDRLTLVTDNKGLSWGGGTAVNDSQVTVLKENQLYYQSSGRTSAHTSQPYVFEYTYRADNGLYYTYYIGYIFPQVTKKSICVASDTLVTLADGTQKRIDELSRDDQILAWDFKEGKYVSTGITVVVNHGYDYNDVIKLTFDDGTMIKAVNGHGFFSAETNEWVIVDAANVNDFLNSEFVLADGNTYKTAKLIDVVVTTEYVEAWGLVADNHRNCISNGLFSITPTLPFGAQQTIYTVGGDMKYDAEMMQADIDKYGLYTYEEFAHLLTREEFEAFNVAEFKVMVGKGYCTYDDVIDNIVGFKYYQSVQP